MGPPIYDGKIHPNEYVKEMRVYCNFRQITNEQEILKFAIMMIDSTINIPENINSFDTLINTLKNHISFTVFKNSCKRKLQALKYISEYEESEGNNTVNFITDFRTLCRDAEITNIEEQRKYLINALPYNFSKNEFVKYKNANSTDELIKTFEEIVTDYSRIIRNGSTIALRHVGTGKYLSSCDKKYPHSNQQYQNHNQQFPQNVIFGRFPHQIQIPSLDYMVYCGDFGPNALWSINSDNNGLVSASLTYCGLDPNPIDYKSSIRLQHKILNKYFYTNISKQSPTSKHFEACCGDNYQFPWSIKRYLNHYNKGNVKSGDIILLQWNNNNDDINNINNNFMNNNVNRNFMNNNVNRNFYNYCHNNNVQQHEHGKDIFLRSHDLKFTVDNENYQEVVTHDQRIGGNDQWCIELVEYP